MQAEVGSSPQGRPLCAAPPCSSIGKRGYTRVEECGSSVAGEWEWWEEHLFSCAYIYLPVDDQAQKAGYASLEPDELTNFYLGRMQTWTLLLKIPWQTEVFQNRVPEMLNLEVIH